MIVAHSWAKAIQLPSLWQYSFNLTLKTHSGSFVAPLVPFIGASIRRCCHLLQLISAVMQVNRLAWTRISLLRSHAYSSWFLFWLSQPVACLSVSHSCCSRLDLSALAGPLSARCSFAAFLFQMPEFEVEYFSHRYICFLCWELPRACVFLDCCHIVTCSRCCYQTSVCPICYHHVSARIFIVNL